MPLTSEHKTGRMVSVNAAALATVLRALVGPPHYIREIQATRNIAALTGGDDPIGTLIDDYNRGVDEHGPL